jgi:Flp pilus assembly protein TadB
MTIFVFIIMIIVISSIVAPLAKGYGERLSKGAPENRDIQRLTTELEQAEQRLAEAERRLLLAEERLDFQEKLLSSRSGIQREP